MSNTSRKRRGRRRWRRRWPKGCTWESIWCGHNLIAFTLFARSEDWFHEGIIVLRCWYWVRKECVVKDRDSKVSLIYLYHRWWSRRKSTEIVLSHHINYPSVYLYRVATTRWVSALFVMVCLCIREDDEDASDCTTRGCFYNKRRDPWNRSHHRCLWDDDEVENDILYETDSGTLLIDITSTRNTRLHVTLLWMVRWIF